MKKSLAVILILCAMLCTLIAGFVAGRYHALHDSTLFVVELPSRNECGGFDEDEITVYLELDGITHECSAFIG